MARQLITKDMAALPLGQKSNRASVEAQITEAVTAGGVGGVSLPIFHRMKVKTGHDWQSLSTRWTERTERTNKKRQLR